MHFHNPAISYPGGKSGLRRDFLHLFPRNQRAYYEPFLGGGSVFIAAWYNRYYDIPCYGSDLYPNLITFYRVLRDYTNPFVNLLISLLKKHEETEYKYLLRELKIEVGREAEWLDLDFYIAAEVWCKSKLAFRALQDGSYSKASAAKYPTTQLIGSAYKLKRFALMLQRHNIHLACESVFEVLDRVVPGSFIYLDPPYYGTESVYVENDFAHDKLASDLMSIGEGRAKWMLSYADHPAVRELYDGAHFLELGHTWQRLSTSIYPTVGTDERREVIELLISNFELDNSRKQMSMFEEGHH